ncbi:MAG: hypothetical protein Q9225_005630 [Loekoesia sp. 1 TL-2023]
MAQALSYEAILDAIANCECGYAVEGEGVYTDAFEANFLQLKDISNDANWEISNYPNPQKPYPLNYQKQNVIPNPLTESSGDTANGGDPGLQLVVRGLTQYGSPVSTAELITKRKDMHYGSYRAAIKYTQEPGTCGSMFWYQSETQEIDVELLSYQDTRASISTPVNLVLHAEGPSGKAEPQVPFHPSGGYHEYRFDYSPGKVSFYTDGQHVKDLVEGVPETPGRIMLNHWSNGDPNWSKGPPAKDVYMTVAYVKAYFNTSSEGTQPRSQCGNPNAEDAVCKVPDQIGPVNPGQGTTFLTSQSPKNQPNQPLPTSISPPTASSTGSSSSAAPNDSVAIPVSPDATCGGAQGYTCMGSEKERLDTVQ